MSRTTLITLVLVSTMGCARAPSAPADSLTNSWTLVAGSFSPSSPVFAANLSESAGVLTGTTTWFDGSYTLSGTHEGATVDLLGAPTQPPTRAWRFSGTVSGNQIVGNVTTDSSVVAVSFLKGGTLPP